MELDGTLLSEPKTQKQNIREKKNNLYSNVSFQDSPPFYFTVRMIFFAFINLELGELALVQLSQGGHG